MRWRVLVVVGVVLVGTGSVVGARREGLRWWVDGHLSADADSLLSAVADVGADGLDPSAYVHARLRALVDSARAGAVASPAVRAELDSELTALFARVAHDLADGPFDPTLIDTTWTAVPHHLDPTAALADALRAHGVRPTLAAFAPPQPGYRALRGELARLEHAVATGGWPVVMPGPALARGARGSRVYALRRRLLAEGDLAPADSLPAAVFDSALADAVRRFQARHGLPADGRVGRETEAQLAIPLPELVRRVRANMMRWRWLPRTPSPRLVVVNTPAATLTLTDGAAPPLTVRVVAGALDWPTPILVAHITDIVLHPTWQVPPAIVRVEMLPAERADSHALARLGVGVWRNGDGTLVPVDPDSVDWRALGDSAATLFQFRQPPGPANPLGAIKFTVPNPFGVAVHDTPTRALFQESARYYSHGCVRVEYPERIAARLLAGWDGWTADSLDAALAAGAELEIPLPTPVPIDFVYRTVWVDEAGQLQWRPDVYDWDEKLSAALGGY